MTMRRHFAPMLVLAGRSVLGGAVELRNASSAITGDMSPIRKVITLIEEMKVQVEKEAQDDLTAYEKYMCWCKTNEEQKTENIQEAGERIEELTAFVEEAAAKEGELKSNIGELKADIAEDQDAMAEAISTREKDLETFEGEEADMKETRGLLDEAIGVLSKVQLLQKQKKATKDDSARARTMLVQLSDRIQQKHPKFAGLMQRDLFEVFGSLEDYVHENEGFLPKRAASSFEQEAQAPMMGAAAGAKSYNARSGGILGILSEMKDQFTQDLSDSQKQNLDSEVNHQSLKAAKTGEIKAASMQQDRAEAELADTLDAAAKAKEDHEATSSALEADQEFLGNMQADCKAEDEAYQARLKVRTEETVALAETLKILTEDDARELYDKTMSFLQLSGSSVSSEASAARERAVDRAMQRIAGAARKHNDWSLVSLAVRVRLDAFTDVKAAMDKMVAELDKQQKEEYEKKEYCNKEIDKTEDDITVGSQTKEDLDSKHKGHVSTMEGLERDIATLSKEDAEMQVSTKQAGEERKEQNKNFQTAVMDQRATHNIMQKALARLKLFYQPNASAEAAFAQVRQHSFDKPGQAVEPAPSKGKAFQKSAASGGVLQLLMKVIADAEVAEKELTMEEQRAQALYSEFVASTSKALLANRASVQKKTQLLAETKSDKSETEEAQRANDDELAKLGDLLSAHHTDCDWLVKYFDTRKKARAEEREAIQDAKSVLSGSDFDTKEDEEGQ